LWLVALAHKCDGFNFVDWLEKVATGFKIRWKSPWQLVNYDLHKVGGSYLRCFLIAFTGAAMIFWTQFEAVTG